MSEMILSLRKATVDDAGILFEWRNDPETRLNSHSTGDLVFDDHVKWLKTTLCNAKRSLFIAEDMGVPVGTVRVDEDSAGKLELSWTVAPEARGRGVAKTMVSTMVNLLPSSVVVRAEIKDGNVASVKVALAAGLQQVGREAKTGILYFERR